MTIGDEIKLTCVKCVTVDPVFQSCLNDLMEGWDNIGYHIDTDEVYCPACGKYLTEVTA